MMISTLMSGYWQQDCVSSIFRRCYSNSTGWLLPKFSYSRKLGLDLVKAWSNVVKQTFACSCRRDAARCARQKPNSEPLFEVSDGVAQRRLRNAQLCCGVREAAFARYSDKGH